MRPRLPSYDHFSVAVGLLVAGVAVTILPWLTLVSLDVVGGLALVVALGVWVVLEQIPEQVNAALDNYLYALPPVLAVGLVALFVGESVGIDRVLPDSLHLPLLGLLVLCGLVGETGRRRRARVVSERESMHALVTVTESRWFAVAISVVGSLLGYAIISVAFGEAFSPWRLAFLAGASVVGAVIGTLFQGRETNQLAVLDGGLLVRTESGRPVTVVPWWQVRRVDVTDGTVRIRRGLPFPTTYYSEFSEREEAKRVVDAIRRCQRRT
ncbi:hypothetical protein SAMN04487950_1082 [Halogranum rubrum]|uniref:PH domain-containing protein n=2 Tax=Halogranum rubrum TaxID=553466 RepID=A0A1I4CBR8_9EURY|nr:hypothetical protein SAMN04487950_1082 [Halogranum rubrum]